MTLCNSFSYAHRTPTVSDNHAPSFPSRRNTLLTSGHASLTTLQHQYHAGGGARGGATLSTGTTSTLPSQLTSPTEMIPPTLMMNPEQQHPLLLSSHSPRTLNTTTATATDNDESVSSAPQRWIGPQHQTSTTNIGTTSTTTVDDTTTIQSPNTPFGVANSFVSDVIPTRQRARSTISGNTPVYPALRISHSNQGLSGLTSPLAGSPRPSRGSHDDGSPRSDHHHQLEAVSTTTTSMKMGHRILAANEQLGSVLL